MRGFMLVCGTALALLSDRIIPALAENPPEPATTSARTGSAISSVGLQSSSVNCPRGELAASLGRAQDAKDADRACKSSGNLAPQNTLLSGGGGKQAPRLFSLPL